MAEFLTFEIRILLKNNDDISETAFEREVVAPDKESLIDPLMVDAWSMAKEKAAERDDDGTGWCVEAVCHSVLTEDGRNDWTDEFLPQRAAVSAWLNETLNAVIVQGEV